MLTLVDVDYLKDDVSASLLGHLLRFYALQMEQPHIVRPSLVTAYAGTAQQLTANVSDAKG